MRRTLVVAVITALLLVARPAFAHVEVAPEEAPRGQTTTFTFSVPNEEAPAKTSVVEVYLPDGASPKGVTAEPPAGWNFAVTNSPGSVVFSGGTIAGEDEVDFKVTLPVPATISGDQMVFKVLQSYDNGEVVRWIDIQTGSEEPPHPAPVVKLTGAVAPTTIAVASLPTGAAPKKADDNDDDGSAAPLILLVALALAGVGAGIAIGARRRRNV
jgi:uncharacterized protein YcnI